MVTRTHLLFLGASLAVLLAAGWYWYGHNASSTGEVPIPSSTGTSSSITVEGRGEFTVTELPATPLPAAPDYNAPVAYGPSVPPQVRAAVEADVVQKRTAIRNNPQDMQAWISLGALYHMGGDEKMAERIWLYTAKMAPNSPLSFYNLGDLYLDYLKDYPKAEASLRSAIALDRTNPAPYRSLFSLYTDYGYKKGTAAAEEVLLEGIAAVPKTFYDPHILLARYYKSLGRTPEASAQYDAAIAGAEAAGRMDVAAELREEQKAL